MSSEPGLETSLTVTEGPITVTKSFAPDEFPVPAVTFVVESDAGEHVHVRLVDSIPESFPMENVGFHPEYEEDNWTRYKSHRVAYDRTLDPGETTTTVYGVRLDGADPASFMSEPTIEFPDDEAVDAGDVDVDDVIGDDSNQIVRDVLSGERDSLPGLDEDGSDVDDPGQVSGSHPPEDLELNLDFDENDEPEQERETEVSGDVEIHLNEEEDEDAGADTTADSTAPEPHAFDASGESATDHSASAVDAVDDDTEGYAVRRDTNGSTDGDVELRLDEADEDEEGTDAEERESADAESAVASGSVVAALAAEIRSGDVDDEDLATLREALDVADSDDSDDEPVQVPRSVDVRISRLQTQVEDLTAYSDALREFLDEEGTGQDVIEDFREEVETVVEEVESLADHAETADEERADLREDVAHLTDRLDEVSEELAELEDDIVDNIQDDLEETRSELRADVDELETQLDEFSDTVEDFRTFRERLSSALGPMVGGPGGSSDDGDEDADADADGDDHGGDE